MISKFLYFKKRETFDSVVQTFPENLSPLCFIEDSNEIWFEGHFFLAGHESLRVSEIDNNVIVSLSESSFVLTPGSSNIQLRARGNSIIVSSSALTRIETDEELEWKEDKLYHKESGIEIGTYGPQNNLEGVNIIKIPKITFNKYGHATNALTLDITIRDYVEQRNSDDTDADRLILLSERSTNTNDVNITRKGNGLSYNNYTQLLKAGSMELSGTKQRSLVIKKGDLVLEDGVIIGKLLGEITGTATPKIHLSENPEYGGASKSLYGHVKLVDTMPLNPSLSSDNSDVNSAGVVAEAASPYLVYSYVNANKFKVGGINASGNSVEVTDRINLTNDFVIQENNVSINWLEL